ncbi:PH domain-containing protein [Actinosynnema sp.]|uniref:PH domain-containing protein n=1 Tax=Actinosynnema sp. TaxID=1872144 RepID=UPI003F8377C1
MALLDAEAGLLVTAAPGTASTALREALLARTSVTEVPASGEVRAAGIDVKHATVAELVRAGFVEADHGLRIVTTTRNPFDFYVAEYERTRRRWVHELPDPGSWVHQTPGAVGRIVDAVTLDFDAWLAKVLAEPGPRRINRGHVDEADVVLRMEHLEHDLRELAGLDLAVPATNVTDRERAYWRAYDVGSRRLVEAAHADDLALFGYVF